VKTATLTAAIQRDLLRTETKTSACECHTCGRPFMPRPSSGDDNTWAFCSTRCREAYDAGWPAYDPNYKSKTNPRWYSLPIGRHGFLIACAGCHKTFDSKGLRCCSTECERDYCRRLEAEAVMAKVGMDAPVKRKCGYHECNGLIPNWRNGRRVRSNYCSKQCQQKAARMAHSAIPADSHENRGQKPR
jgi:hypothetical protein